MFVFLRVYPRPSLLLHSFSSRQLHSFNCLLAMFGDNAQNSLLGCRPTNIQPLPVYFTCFSCKQNSMYLLSRTYSSNALSLTASSATTYLTKMKPGNHTDFPPFLTLSCLRLGSPKVEPQRWVLLQVIDWREYSQEKGVREEGAKQGCVLIWRPASPWSHRELWNREHCSADPVLKPRGQAF